MANHNPQPAIQPAKGLANPLTILPAEESLNLEPMASVLWPYTSPLGDLLDRYLNPLKYSPHQPKNPPVFLDSSELKIFIPLAIHKYIMSTPAPYFSGALWSKAAEKIADMALDYMQSQPTFQDGMCHSRLRLQHHIEGGASKRLLQFKYQGQIECPKQPPFKLHDLSMTIELHDPAISEKEFGHKRDEMLKGLTPFNHSEPEKWYGSASEVREMIRRGLNDEPLVKGDENG